MAYVQFPSAVGTRESRSGDKICPLLDHDPDHDPDHVTKSPVRTVDRVIIQDIMVEGSRARLM